ncbi:hypothetical protein [Kribbella sp. NPDC051137]|uniref:hypothetical protein n=1 Tax=Kribbella sp. NPDC051137 TaxID=3155045 RepID=UPI0034335CB5
MAAIAHGVGYSSEFALSHAFRRLYGIAPGGFRATRRPAPDQPADDARISTGQ